MAGNVRTTTTHPALMALTVSLTSEPPPHWRRVEDGDNCSGSSRLATSTRRPYVEKEQKFRTWAETWGNGPPKFEEGDGPCIRPPNILRSSVCQMRAKARTEF